MSYDVGNIIGLNVRIRPQGLSFANFATAVIFAPQTELPGGFSPDTRRTYGDLTALSADFATTTETYRAANRWLGGIPATRSVIVYGVATADSDWPTTLNKARNQFWWYWTMLTSTDYAVAADVLAASDWCNTNGSFFINNQTGAAVTAIRDPNDDTDIATQLSTLGHRRAYTFTHATDAYAGNALAKYFASVNYAAVASTITGEYKILSGVAAETLTDTEASAMQLDTKRAVFYSVVDLQGSTDPGGRTLNTRTHSGFGEFIDDVVNLDAFSNALMVTGYNTIANSTTKVGQDPVGQALLINSLRAVCDQYVANGYLGPRNYLDPDDAINKFTIGYEILTQPEAILDISDSERGNRRAAPIRIRVFRRGAIHAVDIDVDVF